jgi:hypothetical protein
MLIDLINNINTIFNNIPSNILNLLDFDFNLYNNILKNNNIIDNRLNIYDLFDLILFINKLLHSINALNDYEYKTYIETHLYQIKNLLTTEYIPKLFKDILLYFQNANDTEIINIFDLLDYIDVKNKKEFLTILNTKISEIKHIYFILKKNYNYDNYFNYLVQFKDKSITLTPDIINKFDFINNNDFNIKDINIKKNMVNLITNNDYYSIINSSINNNESLMLIEQNKIIKKNINLLKPNDIINYNDNIEAFLFNYKYYYKEIKNITINNKDKNKILIKKSIFQII